MLIIKTMGSLANDNALFPLELHLADDLRALLRPVQIDAVRFGLPGETLGHQFGKTTRGKVALLKHFECTGFLDRKSVV